MFRVDDSMRTFRRSVRDRTPAFAVAAYRDVMLLVSLMRSRNREFLRFAPPGHFYSPVPDIDDVRRHAGRIFDGSMDAVPGVELNTAAQLALVQRFSAVHAELPFPEHAQPGRRFHLDNAWFSYGDAVALYHMMREFRPSRIVEVGSGFSSAAMLEVDETFFGSSVDMTFIEPYPERLQRLLEPADRRRCTILESGVQDVDPAVFAALEAGDVLFIDSSHVAKAGSDVVHLLFGVLPALAEGVLVHVHDVPWPFEYPRGWFEQGRAWNEAYFMRAFLQYNAGFAITYWAPYLAARHSGAMRAALPTAMRPPSSPTTLGNSSLWLRKIVAA